MKFPASVMRVFREPKQAFCDFLQQQGGFLRFTGSNGAQTVTPTVINRSNEQVAPEVIMFNAETSGFPGVAAVTSVHDEQVQKIDFVWNFGDATSTFDYTDKTFANSGNANTAIGKKVAHAFSAAGTYTVTVTAYMESSGSILSATNTIEVTVADVDTVYTRVAYVHPSGTYTGSPATSGSLNATSIANAIDAIIADAGSGVTPTKIVVADDTAVTQGVYFGTDDTNCPSLYITRSGTGTNRPTAGITGTPSAMFGMEAATGHASKDFIWTEVDVDMPWDSNSETGHQAIFLQPLEDETFGYFLVYSSVIHGCSTAVSYSPFEQGYTAPIEDFRDTFSSIHLHNCDFQSYSDFSMIALCRNISVVGCRQTRGPTDYSGGPKGVEGPWNLHSGVRLQGENVYVGKNDIASAAGWTSGGGGVLDGNTVWVHQPCCRLNTEPQTDGYYNVSENYFEGGYNLIHFQPANTGDNRVAINWQIESNLLVCSWMTFNPINISNTGGRFNNNVIIIPDVDYTITGHTSFAAASGPSSIVGFQAGESGATSTTENENGTLYFTNNTVINRSTGYSVGIPFLASAVASNFPDATIIDQRNIIHAPNASGTDWDLTLTSLFDARNTSDYRYRTDGTVTGHSPIAGTATPAATPTFGVPQAGVSSAINAGTGGNLYTTRDIQGNTRSIPDDLGANAA